MVLNECEFAGCGDAGLRSGVECGELLPRHKFRHSVLMTVVLLFQAGIYRILKWFESPPKKIVENSEQK
jgi:hypothetical protein